MDEPKTELTREECKGLLNLFATIGTGCVTDVDWRVMESWVNVGIGIRRLKDLAESYGIPTVRAGIGRQS